MNIYLNENTQHGNICLWLMLVMPLMGCYSFGYSTIPDIDVLSGEQSYHATTIQMELPTVLSDNRVITPIINLHFSDIRIGEYGASYDWTNKEHFWKHGVTMDSWRCSETNEYRYAGVGVSYLNAVYNGEYSGTIVAHCRAGIAWNTIFGIYGFQARLVLGDTIEVAGYDINTTNVQLLLTFTPPILAKLPPHQSY